MQKIVFKNRHFLVDENRQFNPMIHRGPKMGYSLFQISIHPRSKFFCFSATTQNIKTCNISLKSLIKWLPKMQKKIWISRKLDEEGLLKVSHKNFHLFQSYPFFKNAVFSKMALKIEQKLKNQNFSLHFW